MRLFQLAGFRGKRPLTGKGGERMGELIEMAANQAFPVSAGIDSINAHPSGISLFCCLYAKII